MSNKIYGYVRVSSKEQNEGRQLVALAKYSIPEANIFIDKQSGKDFNRPAYKALVKKIGQGDLLIVKSIDRLGRNYNEILEQWRFITKEVQGDILVVDMPLLDTRTQSHDLTGTLIADLVLQILSYTAQTEREAIKQRQAEGIAVARAKGVRFGRKPIELPMEFKEVCEAFKNGEITTRVAAQKLKMSTSTFHRYCQKYCQ